LPARRQTLRSNSIREPEHVRAARYALKRSRSRTGRPPGHRRRPAFMRAPARPHAALLDAVRLLAPSHSGAVPLLDAAVVPAVQTQWWRRPRRCAVRARMKGWRLEGWSRRRSAATRALQRVSSRAYVSGSQNLFESGVRSRANELQTSCFAGGAGTGLPGLPARLRVGRRPSGPAPHTAWGDVGAATRQCTSPEMTWAQRTRQRKSGPQAAFRNTPPNQRRD
jgi:hypothetical protein